MCDEIHADDEGTLPCHPIPPLPPILTSNNDADTDFQDIPPLFHDSEWQCPVGNVCQNHLPRERACLLKGCDRQYKPMCHLMIFCSRKCYDKSRLRENWDALINFCRNHRNRQNLVSKFLENLRKENYRRRPSGQAQRAREYATRYAKEKERDRQAAEPEVVVIPEPEIPVVKKQPVVISPEEQILRRKHRETLNRLMFGTPEIKTPPCDSDEIISVPAGVVPRYCKALGCNEVVVPRSQNTEKRFCSRDCMNVFRNTLQNLKEAWKATRCPFLKLLIILLQQL